MSSSASFEAWKGKELVQTGRDVLGCAIEWGVGKIRYACRKGLTKRRQDLGRRVSC